MSYFPVFINVGVFALVLFGLNMLAKKHISFNIRVLIGMLAGVAFGVILQLTYGVGSEVIASTNNWVDIVGSGYVRLLSMIIIPLILVSITFAIASQGSKNFGKTALKIICVLLITVAIAAAIGAITATVFDLDASSITMGQEEIDRGAALDEKQAAMAESSVQEKLVEIIPKNVFYALTGQGGSATLSVVFISALIGVAVLGVKRKNPESADFFIKFITSSKDIVMRIVALVLRFTPYGVFAIMTTTLSTSEFSEIAELGVFLIASYVAILIMFIIHLVILTVFGMNPIQYVKKALPVFAFAFSSRSSAGTMPITINALTDKMGVNEGTANLSASFGTTIGQNGCAGIYPAMLAVMIAPTMGINPLDPVWFLTLIVVTTISSIGIAGVGGGATFAALAVLSIMNMDIALAGVLISIEPLIDMARTMLNVSDSMVSGLVTSKLDKDIDMDVYNGKVTATEF